MKEDDESSTVTMDVVIFVTVAIILIVLSMTHVI